MISRWVFNVLAYTTISVLEHSICGIFILNLIYFKCYTKEGYFPDSHNREEHHEAILSAIPAFLHFVEQAEIPADMENNRWGVSAWHHPGCIELLQSYNPEQELEEILEKWLEDKTIGSVRKRPRELYLELDNLAGYSFARCSRSIGHLGHQLGHPKLP